jgi:hypothetical protein
VSAFLESEYDLAFKAKLQAEGRQGVTAVLWAGHNDINVRALLLLLLLLQLCPRTPANA